ncbi:Protein of unknown function [Rhizobium sp. RU20A]|uniref:DUF4087 domain-containing protein n=1 Tax=Rhizobium sp. RU20A TaxID=1907412 RepID=UPI000953CD20|nr:DUF4087 domain-containing protein [Rhizobium sp. RU20A]SIQ17654.1 Protein of unknown function [Rhizobium sp. RU20A]
MKSLIPLVFLSALTFSVIATGAAAAENRCGYIENPTPGNWWLTDADASWTIGTQGSDAYPDGFDLVPDISAGDYRATNGNYGYACACMSVDTDRADERITAIYSFKQIPLSRCEKDPALNRPE